MKKIHFFIIMVLLLSAHGFAFAQKQVSGLVIDEKGTPLIGVSVVESGTTNGTTTGIDGRYSLRFSSQKFELTFSYVGYRTQTVNAANRSQIDVKMEVMENSLDEVVVVGYATQKKVNVTGAVTAVDFTKQAEGRPIMNTSAALAGLAPGMNVSQTSGQPGSEDTNIRLRGVGSFTSSSCSPLILVDGVEWSMNNINPNDIATISVLRDAASTAIYGTRAANGVILVTTKKGASRAQISYSYSGIVQMPYNNLSFVNDYARYMELVDEACYNVGTKELFSANSIKTWREAKANPNGKNSYGVPNSVAFPNTDWFDEIFKPGYSQEHNLSVTGASDKVNYAISMGYLDNQGIMNRWNLDSSTQRMDFRANMEAKVKPWFTLGTRLFGQKQDYGMANINNGFKYLYQTTPGVYPGEPNYWGRPALAAEESSNANNIFGQMAGATGYNRSWRLNGSLYAIVTPYKGLSFEGTFNYAPVWGDKSSYSRKNGYWDYVTDSRYSDSSLEKASITNSTSFNYRMSTELLARYNTKFGDNHSLGVLFGYSAIAYRSKSQSISRMGATDWSIHELSTYETLVDSSSSSPSGWGLRSYFGRVNYSFKDRYLFEANLRADGSSRFGENKRYGYFPSFSAGWRISEEPWLKGG